MLVIIDSTLIHFFFPPIQHLNLVFFQYLKCQMILKHNKTNELKFIIEALELRVGATIISFNNIYLCKSQLTHI